ncbi:class I SAM-dependent methyltransferase [Paenibacillus sp. TRM 82003]|nr:class I SAM-dependent methyltransferase [Paenibacillus sp. TRM 82003]
MNNRVVATTTYDPSPDSIARAEAAAAELGGVYAPRARFSIARLRKRYGDDVSIVVASASGFEWHDAGGAPPFFFHPGMSLVRAKRLAAGGRDAMLEAAMFAPGDAVLDCTAGLCADAILFSFAGGPGTRVTALESQYPLHFIVKHGLREYASDWEPFANAMRRVEALHREHDEYLRSLPDNAYDIVYFDPMFREPERASSGISPLRAFANAGAVRAETIEQAKRVARKAVVLKEKGQSQEWARLGFDVVSKPNAAVGYGVMLP